MYWLIPTIDLCMVCPAVEQQEPQKGGPVLDAVRPLSVSATIKSPPAFYFWGTVHMHQLMLALSESQPRSLLPRFLSRHYLALYTILDKIILVTATVV